MSSGERVCSPSEYAALDASAELFPIRCNRLAAVESIAPSVDFFRPSGVDTFALGIVEALEQPGRDLGTVALRKGERLFE